MWMSYSVASNPARVGVLARSSSSSVSAAGKLPASAASFTWASRWFGVRVGGGTAVGGVTGAVGVMAGVAVTACGIAVTTTGVWVTGCAAGVTGALVAGAVVAGALTATVVAVAPRIG